MSYRTTGVDWANFCRDIYVEYYSTHIAPTKFEGEIEIDESLFGRRCKHHRGAPKGAKIWIVGLIEKSSNRIKLIPVHKRNAETMIPIIKDNVSGGSCIFIDCWRAYNSLNQEGFKHYTVNHKKAFKSTYKEESTGELITVHTNRIEGAWKHAKVNKIP